MTQKKSFNVGDKVVVVSSDSGWPLGTVLTFERYYVSASGYFCFDAIGETMGCVVAHVELDSIVNSPLYKALT